MAPRGASATDDQVALASLARNRHLFGMYKLSFDAAWADLVAIGKSNASVLAVLGGAFLLLPNFAELLFAPPPRIESFDWNGLRQMEEYYQQNVVVLMLCNLPVWLGSAGILSLLLDSRRLTVGEALKSGFRLLPSIIILNWLTQFMIVSGLLLLLVPGIYLIGRLMLAAPAQMAERIGNPFRAIGRSFDLSAGNGWRIAGFVALIVVVAIIVASAANAVFGILLNLVLPKDVLGEGLALLRSAIGALNALLLLLVGAALYRQQTLPR
ncbi:MAG: hypothetical protein IPP45_04970 [Sphingomonadales bacterium]|nr:hypothetical protein [Sphingomonadales bacterium]